MGRLRPRKPPSSDYEYALAHLEGNASDYDLVELAAYLDSTEHELQAMGHDPPGPWNPDHVRLFVSHTHPHARFAGGLRQVLGSWLIDAFVAHDNLEPTEEWQTTIESALRTCHVAAAIVTPDFSASKWCDQEVGFCLGRPILIVPLMLGTAPYGFLAKFQAITIKRGQDAPSVAAELLTVLAMHPETQERVMPCVVRRFTTSDSNDAARDGFALLGRMPRWLWNPLNVSEVEHAIEDKSQLRNAKLGTGEPLPDAVEKLLARIGIGGRIPLLTDLRKVEQPDTPF